MPYGRIKVYCCSNEKYYYYIKLILINDLYLALLNQNF